MRTLMLEVREVNTVDHVTIEVTGTWPRISSPTAGKAFARRRIDRVVARASQCGLTDLVARAVGAACEDVVRQVIEQGGN